MSYKIFMGLYFIVTICTLMQDIGDKCKILTCKSKFDMWRLC